jgi:hypothetical protein
LVSRLRQWRPPANLAVARREIVKHLATISVEGNYFTWRRFDPKNQAAREAVEPLVRSLNTCLPRLLKPA